MHIVTLPLQHKIMHAAVCMLPPFKNRLIIWAVIWIPLRKHCMSGWREFTSTASLLTNGASALPVQVLAQKEVAFCFGHPGSLLACDRLWKPEGKCQTAEQEGSKAKENAPDDNSKRGWNGVPKPQQRTY